MKYRFSIYVYDWVWENGSYHQRNHYLQESEIKEFNSDLEFQDYSDLFWLKVAGHKFNSLEYSRTYNHGENHKACCMVVELIK